jgi:tetratricopeptide (TPR) repeat protein
MSERTARACLLAPVTGAPLAQATKLAEKGIADKQHWVMPWGLTAKSLADYRNERYAAAVESASAALRKNTNYNVQIPARYIMAMAQQGAGKTDEARKTLADADTRFDAMVPQEANLPADSLHDWLTMGLLRREAHERIPGAALPEDRSEHLRRARAYSRIGQTKKADAEFQAFIAGQEDQPRPWLLRAQAFGELGRREQAEADLTRARKLLEQAPSAVRADASLWRDLALACKATGKAPEAITAYRQALTLQRKALEGGAIAEPDRQRLRELYAELTQELRAAGQSAEADALVAEMWKECDTRGINPVQLFKGHTHQWVEGVAVLPNGRQALSCGYDGFVRLWDIATAREIRTYRHDDPIRSVALAPDGRRFLSASHDGLVRLWDVESGKEVRRYAGHTAGVLTVAFVPGGHEHRLEGYEQAVWGVAISPDGRQVLAGDAGGLLILWDLQTGKEVRRFTGKPSWGRIRAPHFLADGRQALLGASEVSGSRLVCLDLSTGKELYALKGPSFHSGMALMPDGRHVLTADGDKTVRVWTLPEVAGAVAAVKTNHESTKARKHEEE